MSDPESTIIPLVNESRTRFPVIQPSFTSVQYEYSKWYSIYLYQTAIFSSLYTWTWHKSSWAICKSLRLFCYYFNDLDIKRIEADHSFLCPNTKESTEYDLWRLIGICNISVICNGFALEKARQDSTRAVTAYYRSIRKPEVLSFVMWQNKVKVNMDDSWRPKDAELSTKNPFIKSVYYYWGSGQSAWRSSFGFKLNQMKRRSSSDSVAVDWNKHLEGNA